ncbi:MAG TPA: AtpZ/AtpI family protein [Brumimicrobium sp.]|nr:AtpZ/AtpI family protein [Brumimicrobium sp.]
MSDKKDEEDKKNGYKKYLRFSGIAFQMGITILIGALGGQKLDSLQENESQVWTIILTLLAVFASMYIVIKEVIKLGKED